MPASFDGESWWERSALVVNGDRIEGIIAADSPTDATRVPLGGGILAPGFIDLQVNGGGGALLNLTPDVPTIATICAAFAQFGTTACLPTLITDTREKNAAVRSRLERPPRHKACAASSAFTSRVRI